MKEACVTCLQLRNELVNLFFEFFRLFDLENPVGSGFNNRVPIHAVELRVEVSSFDKAAYFLEYGFAVLAAKGHWGSDKRLAPSPVIVNPAQ